VGRAWEQGFVGEEGGEGKGGRRGRRGSGGESWNGNMRSSEVFFQKFLADVV